MLKTKSYIVSQKNTTTEPNHIGLI